MSAGILALAAALVVCTSASPVRQEPAAVSTLERRAVAVDGKGPASCSDFVISGGCLDLVGGLIGIGHGCLPVSKSGSQNCYCDADCYEYSDCCADILLLGCMCKDYRRPRVQGGVHVRRYVPPFSKNIGVPRPQAPERLGTNTEDESMLPVDSRFDELLQLDVETNQQLNPSSVETDKQKGITYRPYHRS